ncbi:hypothetical protein Tco_1283541 [Tanacetum coccineum]
MDSYLGSKLKESVDVAVQLKSDRIREEAQVENEDFFNKIDDNVKKIIKEQVNAKIKKKVKKILPRIEKLVNEQLDSEVLIRSSNKAKTSHAVAANLSELELKKILIDKMENNKSVNRSDVQKNLYKALVDASDRGSKRRRAGKEPESTSVPKGKTSKKTSKLTEGSKSRHKSAGQSTYADEPMHNVHDFEEPTHQEPPTPDRDWNKTLPADHGPVQPWLSNLARQEDPRESFDELMDTPLDFSAFMMNRLKVDTLTPELLAGPTFELMKGTCKSLIIEWHGYKHLDWITVRRDDDNLHTFKEGDFKRLHLQDIEDMLLLLVQGKMTNLNVKRASSFQCISLNVHKKSDLKRREAYSAYSNPRGFIYHNIDKKNKLMRVDELHKFSDGTLNDVRTALDDHLKGIRMEYLP